MTRMSARDRILDSFEAILTSEGERAATLDAVAASAEVSKGGLLYHFPNRESLVAGLLDRLRTLADGDVAAMSAAPEGPALYYVASSRNTGSPFDRALIAASRLGWEKHPEASETIRSIQRRWLALIRAEVGDEGVTQAIMLLGDGLYYNAAFGGEGFAEPGNYPLAELLEVVRRLIATAPVRPGPPTPPAED